MAVFPAHPPRRVDRRLAPDAAQRDRRRARGDGGARESGTQIRAFPPVRLIRPVAHPRRRRRGGRGDAERQRPVADRDGRPAARRGGRGGGGHPDRRRLDARGRRRRQSRVLSARRVVPDRAAGRPVQLRAARPRRQARRRPRRATADSAVIAERHGLQLGDELRIPGLPPGSAHLGWTFPEFDRVAGHQRRLRAAGAVGGRRRDAALLARLRHGRIRPSETGR